MGYQEAEGPQEGRSSGVTALEGKTDGAAAGGRAGLCGMTELSP